MFGLPFTLFSYADVSHFSERSWHIAPDCSDFDVKYFDLLKYEQFLHGAHVRKIEAKAGIY